MPIVFRLTLMLAVIGLFTVCATSASTLHPPTPPTTPGGARPALPGLALASAPGAQATEREWDVEIEYERGDAEAVLSFYEDLITRQGWTEVSRDIDASDGEYEIHYIKNGLELELDIELDSSKIEVEIDIDEPMVSGAAYSLYRLPGLELELVPGFDVLELDVEVDYRAANVAGIFDHYDRLIQSQGWTRVELERDSDEVEALYRRGASELEVERDDGEVEVDIDIDFR